MNIKKFIFQNKVKSILFVSATVVFLVLIIFLDANNLREQYKYRSKTDDLKAEKIYFQEKIKVDSTKLHELNTDDENLEKYAREKYLMKKENEEIYLVKDKNKN